MQERRVQRRRGRCGGLAPAGASLLLLLAGCHEFADHRDELNRYHAAGRYDLAANALDDPQTRARYARKSEVLWELDRGAVALALGDPDQAIQLLDAAERRIELKTEASSGDVLARWALNDAEAEYVAEPYEDIYVNVVKLMAQLVAGRIGGGATVEARRLARKADTLRDRYLKYEAAVRARGAPGPGASRSAYVPTNDAGRFLESPLGTYLTAITFMEDGNAEFQGVAARRLTDSIALQRGLIGPVREEDFAGLADLRPDEADVLVVALSGRGPTKVPERVGPIPIGTWPLYFELPRLAWPVSVVTAASLEIEPAAGEEGGGGTAATSLDLAMVEDLSAVAAENHRRMLPLIQARTIIRSSLKAGLSVAATEAARRQASDQDQGWVQLAGVLAGLALVASTEKADLRCWAFLPGQARVGVMDLAPGEYRARVVYRSAGGGTVHTTAWTPITVQAAGLTTVLGYYWD